MGMYDFKCESKYVPGERFMAGGEQRPESESENGTGRIRIGKRDRTRILGLRPASVQTPPARTTPFDRTRSGPMAGGLAFRTRAARSGSRVRSARGRMSRLNSATDE